MAKARANESGRFGGPEGSDRWRLENERDAGRANASGALEEGESRDARDARDEAVDGGGAGAHGDGVRRRPARGEILNRLAEPYRNEDRFDDERDALDELSDELLKLAYLEWEERAESYTTARAEENVEEVWELYGLSYERVLDKPLPQ